MMLMKNDIELYLSNNENLYRTCVIMRAYIQLVHSQNLYGTCV